jgi:hypothetical protein
MIKYPFKAAHQFFHKILVLLLVVPIALSITSISSKALDFGVAGVPRDLAFQRNYNKIFRILVQNGITEFFPTFQYQEIPNPISYGYEKDFSAPCRADSKAFKALRNTNMKLLIPAEIVYPNPKKLRSVSGKNSPLAQIIACAGIENIAGITNYDEAVFQGVSIDSVRAFYTHAKSVAPSIPVLLVHGPIIMDKSVFNSARKRDRYLDKVIAFSAYADIIGFDVYPVPIGVSRVATPLSKGKHRTADKAIGEYMSWLNDAIPSKPKLMILQGFSYADMYESSFLKANISKELRDYVKPPIAQEIDAMVKQAQQKGVTKIIWWGQAALKNSTQAPWPDILRMGRKY